MGDTSSRALRGLLLGGAIFLWLVGLLWVLQRKGIVTTSRSDSEITYGAEDAEGRLRKDRGGLADGVDEDYGEEPVSEIILKGGPSEEELAEQARLAALAEATTGPEEELPKEDAGPPTYPVWFESERDIGVCKITWEGGSRLANLHVSARMPEGRLEFSYRCGNDQGRGAIDVKPSRVNGVLFCREVAGVSVKTVRKKDARCARR